MYAFQCVCVHVFMCTVYMYLCAQCTCSVTVCIYVCMYVCQCVCMCVTECMCAYVCMCMSVYTQMKHMSACWYANIICYIQMLHLSSHSNSFSYYIIQRF